MSEDIFYADATELADRIRTKDLSPVEVMSAHLERIEAVNPKLNAIVTLADDAMDRARDAEAAVMGGDTLGPLHGVPFTLKDCVDNKGVRITRGSKLFGDRVADTDAAVASRLKGAGGIFLGITNMPEFAFWWETGNEVFGRTATPWKEGHTPGGSSGGETAAIAAGMSPLGVGSDVGGSIRQPSSYCGVVGLKATHGRIPLTGTWPVTMQRFFHVGPMARTVRDVALALSVMCGPDGADPYAIPVPPPKFSHLGDPLPKLRVGWCAEGPLGPVATDIQDAVAKAAATLAELGCEVDEVSLAEWEDLPARAISMSFFLGEGSHYLNPYTKGHEDELTWYIKKRMSLPMPSFEDFMVALSNTELLRLTTVEYFTRFDILLLPTTPTPAHVHEARELVINGQSVPGRHSLNITVPFDLTGSPAVNVPFGWSDDGLPIGVQVVARHFDEATQLHVASALEAVHSADRRRPAV